MIAETFLKKRNCNFFLILILALLLFPPSVFAYLDLGTGSYFFQIAMAFVFSFLFSVKIFWKKCRLFLINLLKSHKKNEK
jgi:hypothetical protein